MTTSILKRTILFCSFVCTIFFAEAQFTIAPTIGAGLTAATLSAPAAVGTGSNVKTNSYANVNASIGVGVTYQFDDFWAVNSGIFYQYISPKFNQNTNPSTIIVDKLNYINIPVGIVHTNEHLKRGFYYGIGADFGLPVSGSRQETTADGTPSVNTTIKFDGGSYTNSSDEATTTHLNFLNIGLTGKFGYFFGKTFIGVDGNFGLINLINSDNKSNYKLNTYGIHVGYTIGRKVVPVKPADTTVTP